MTDFSDHYARLEPLYSELGQLDRLYCVGNHDFTGWYNERGKRARVWCLGREYGGIRANLDRVMYATNTYVSQTWFMDAFTPYEWTDNGREWHGEKPTPEYSDIQAYAPFADIDLSDDVKHDRPDGDIPQERIERALAMYADAFADLAGDMSHVFGLDSVGGAYLFVAPSATRPIADRLDSHERGLFFGDMMDRLNDWLAGVNDDVIAEYPDLEGVFEADCVNNKNRLYKAPLSVHSSLDGVVTPVDPTNPDYSFTPACGVADRDVRDATEWAAGFTDDHTDAVEHIVSTLWPDYHTDADSWTDAVDARVDDLEAQEQQYTENDGTEIDADALPDDLETATDIEVLNATIEALDVRDVARQVADDYDTANRGGPTRFNPPWRQSESGQSCFVDRDKFVDLAEGHNGGGALKLVARADRDIGVNHCSDSVRGEDYWKAITKLRSLGYEIPRFKGDDGAHPDYLGLYDEPDSDADKRQQVIKALRQ